VVARFQAGDAGADGLDDAGRLVAGDRGQLARTQVSIVIGWLTAYGRGLPCSRSTAAFICMVVSSLVAAVSRRLPGGSTDGRTVLRRLPCRPRLITLR